MQIDKSKIESNKIPFEGCVLVKILSGNRKKVFMFDAVSKFREWIEREEEDKSVRIYKDVREYLGDKDPNAKLLTGRFKIFNFLKKENICWDKSKHFTKSPVRGRCFDSFFDLDLFVSLSEDKPVWGE